MMFAKDHDENERTDVMMQIKVHKAVKTLDQQCTILLISPSQFFVLFLLNKINESMKR